MITANLLFNPDIVKPILTRFSISESVMFPDNLRQSELVRDSIFASDWLLASENFKRSMRVMMSRSNQPVVVRVGGWITLSRESYWSVSYTHFTGSPISLHSILGEKKIISWIFKL
jgi:hypothetical protein